MINDDIFNKIEAWLSGELSQSEAKGFEAEIASNPELAREVERHLNGQKALDHLAVQAMQKNMATWRESMDNIPPPPVAVPGNKKNNWFRLITGYFILPLLLVLAGFWFWSRQTAQTGSQVPPNPTPHQQTPVPSKDQTPTTPQPIVKDPVPPQIKPSQKMANTNSSRLLALAETDLKGFKSDVLQKYPDNRRGTSTSQDTVFSAGIEAFLHSDHKLAEKLLLQIKVGEKNHADAQEILASIYLENKQYKQAIACYEVFFNRYGTIHTDLTLLHFYLTDFPDRKGAFWKKMNQMLDPVDPHKYRRQAEELKEALLKMGISEDK